MKYLIVIFASVSCSLIFAQSHHSGYEIKGNIKGLSENTKIYLIHGDKRKKIDSTIVKNEKFVLKGKVTDTFFAYLYEGKNNQKLADILLDNSKISLVGGMPVLDSINVSGSKIDKQWKTWY